MTRELIFGAVSIVNLKTTCRLLITILVVGRVGETSIMLSVACGVEAVRIMVSSLFTEPFTSIVGELAILARNWRMTRRPVRMSAEWCFVLARLRFGRLSVMIWY